MPEIDPISCLEDQLLVPNALLVMDLVAVNGSGDRSEPCINDTMSSETDTGTRIVPERVGSLGS